MAWRLLSCSDEGPVTVAQITKPGLAAISIAVALLWGTLIGQRLLMREALLERARVLRQIVRPVHRSEPVIDPVPFVHRRFHPIGQELRIKIG